MDIQHIRLRAALGLVNQRILLRQTVGAEHQKSHRKREQKETARHNHEFAANGEAAEDVHKWLVTEEIMDESYNYDI